MFIKRCISKLCKFITCNGFDRNYLKMKTVKRIVVIGGSAIIFCILNFYVASFLFNVGISNFMPSDASNKIPSSRAISASNKSYGTWSSVGFLGSGLPSLFGSGNNGRPNYLVTIKVEDNFIHESQVLSHSPHVDFKKISAMRRTSQEFPMVGVFEKLKVPNIININSPSRILLGINSLGRLGNNMCQYAHLYIFGLKDHVQIAIDQELRSKLKAFESISVPVVLPEDLKEANITLPPTTFQEVLDAIAENGTLRGNITGYPCLSHLFWSHHRSWRKEFAFNDTILGTVVRRKEMLINKWMARNNEKNYPDAMVGVHIRRTDYLQMLKRFDFGGYLPLKYYWNSFRYFRERFKKVMFVIGSDDLKWCERNMVRKSDVIVVDKGSAIEDMALLASFEHQIYSHGTYALWIALLSKASTIVYPGSYEKKRYYQHLEFDRVAIFREFNFVEINF